MYDHWVKMLGTDPPLYCPYVDGRALIDVCFTTPHGLVVGEFYFVGRRVEVILYEIAERKERRW